MDLHSVYITDKAEVPMKQCNRIREVVIPESVQCGGELPHGADPVEEPVAVCKGETQPRCGEVAGDQRPGGAGRPAPLRAERYVPRVCEDGALCDARPGCGAGVLIVVAYGGREDEGGEGEEEEEEEGGGNGAETGERGCLHGGGGAVVGGGGGWRGLESLFGFVFVFATLFVLYCIPL